MASAIIVFFLAIFFGAAFLGIVIFLFWRWRRSQNNVNRLSRSMNSANYENSESSIYIHQSNDTDDYYQTTNDSIYETSATSETPVTEPEKHSEAQGFVAEVEKTPDYSSSSTSDYSSYSDSSSGYDSSSSSSDYSSGSDSGSSSSSSD